MVPAPSVKVPRVSTYSGYRAAAPSFRLRGSHPLWQAFPKPFRWDRVTLSRSIPHDARAMVWARPLSLAATYGFDVSFSSSGYLDVSVHRVPLHTLCVGVWIHAVFACGFPHSDTRGSMGICPSPRLFAACRVLHRLPVPRHPPRALFCLTTFCFRLSRHPSVDTGTSDFYFCLLLSIKPTDRSPLWRLSRS